MNSVASAKHARMSATYKKRKSLQISMSTNNPDSKTVWMQTKSLFTKNRQYVLFMISSGMMLQNFFIYPILFPQIIMDLVFTKKNGTHK